MHHIFANLSGKTYHLMSDPDYTTIVEFTKLLADRYSKARFIISKNLISDWRSGGRLESFAFNLAYWNEGRIDIELKPGEWIRHKDGVNL